MGAEVTKNTVIYSLLWKFLERGGTQGIQVVVTIILARLLLPDEFGLMVIVTIFISMAGIITQGGFNTALIQKKKVDELDLSSVFFLNVLLATLLYIVLYITAPFIANFFEQPQLETLIKILSFTLFITAFNTIQTAVISRTMQFKKLSICSLLAVLVSGIVGVVCAYTNLGIWALVAQQLSFQFILTIILFFLVEWRPKLLFSLTRLKSLFSFGWKLLVSGLIDNIDRNIKGILIGKLFSPSILAFYSRGEQYPDLIVNNFNGAIQSVMFPTLASCQDDKQRFKGLVRRSIVTSSFIIFPTMVGLAVIAEPLVVIVLTEKWLPVVPFLQLFCAAYALYPIHTVNLQAINALGRSDIFLKLEIIKKAVGLIFLLVSLKYGPYAVAVSIVISGFLASILNAYPNTKLLDYRIGEQWRDIIPSLLLSLFMGMGVYSIYWIELPVIITLLIQIIVGPFLYISLAVIFKLECFSYLLVTLRELLRSRRSIQLKVEKI